MRTPLRAVTALALGLPLSMLAVSPSFAAGKGKADTTPPSVAITTPGSGTSTSSSLTVAGSASDNKALASVSVSLDGGSWVTASGTTSWSRAVSGLAAGSHTAAARAVDAAGNSSTSSVSFTVSTTTTSTTTTTTTSPSPSPSPTASPSPTSSPSPSPTATSTTSTTSTGTAPATQGTWTSPEGMVISVSTAGSWTIAKVYQLMLDASAGPGDFARVAPMVDVQVQDTYASQTATSAVGGSGSYSYYHATIYLKGVNSGFVSAPEATSTHEYGHAWNLMHLYLDHGGDWSGFTTKRWSSADGSVTLAQDYRLLFGNSLAVSEWPNHLNTTIVDPRNQPGLKTWFQGTWL